MNLPKIPPIKPLTFSHKVKDYVKLKTSNINYKIGKKYDRFY